MMKHFIKLFPLFSLCLLLCGNAQKLYSQSNSFGPSNGASTVENSFTATVHSGYNHLSWQTYSEVSIESFIVQKSNDGKEFYSIDTLNAVESFSPIQDYIYDDSSISFNRHYHYRLIQKDIDGTATRYSTIRVGRSTGMTAFIVVSQSGLSHFVVSNCKGQKIGIEYSDIHGKVLSKESVVVTDTDYSEYLNNKFPDYSPVIIKACFGGQFFRGVIREEPHASTIN